MVVALIELTSAAPCAEDAPGPRFVSPQLASRRGLGSEFGLSVVRSNLAPWGSDSSPNLDWDGAPQSFFSFGFGFSFGCDRKQRGRRPALGAKRAARALNFTARGLLVVKPAVMPCE